MQKIDSSTTTQTKNYKQPTVNLIPWSPWLAVVFVIVVYLLSQIIAGLLISLYPALQHQTAKQINDWLQNSVWAQFGYVALAEGLALLAIYWFLRAYKVSWRTIGLRRPQWKDPAWGVAFVPLYFLSYFVIVAVVHGLVPSLNVDQAQQLGFTDVHGFGPLLLTFLSLVILPPLVEEIMVRGFLYTSLKKGLPQIAAALVASVIFATGHLQVGSGAPLLWIAFIDTFVLSLFLIYLRDKTNGLWASMTLHASKNLIAFISLFILHLS